VAEHIKYDPRQITFRKLTEADLPLLHRWLNTPHVSQWWEVDGKRNPEYNDVISHFIPRIGSRKLVNYYLVLYDARPVAYIQSCSMDNFPTEKTMLKIHANAVGIDTFIGEVDFLHKGFGSAYIRQFLRDVIFREPGITSCIIDPEPMNKIAIRAYEKAGFSFSHTAWNAKDRVKAYIMTINWESVYQTPAVL
jgi:RimJ/RimL family protein N-acetyltransferase